MKKLKMVKIKKVEVKRRSKNKLVHLCNLLRSQTDFSPKSSDCPLGLYKYTHSGA